MGRPLENGGRVVHNMPSLALVKRPKASLPANADGWRAKKSPPRCFDFYRAERPFDF